MTVITGIDQRGLPVKLDLPMMKTTDGRSSSACADAAISVAQPMEHGSPVKRIEHSKRDAVGDKDWIMSSALLWAREW